ncbi:MAG: hypothetical protein ABI578_06025 [Chloroflexota bacterium]
MRRCTGATLGPAPQTALAALLLTRVALVLTTLIGSTLLPFSQQKITRAEPHGSSQPASVSRP